MKKIITAFTILAASFSAMGQAPTKFDFYLAQKQAAITQHTIDGAQVIEVLVKGKIEAIKELVNKNHGVFKYSYGNIAAIRIPLNALSDFYLSPSVIRMEGAPPHIRPCNDTMRVHAHITEVQMGLSPLTQPYKGKGVIVGMIDSGIDFVHPDFRDSLGNSRILAIWDMTKPANQFTPFPYGYGQEWDKPTLDTALANNNATVLKSMDSSSALEYGHGSHVSGVATGNGRANGLSIGAAPEADIMAVVYNFSSQSNNEMTDATSFLFNKASALSEPCVINASLGDYDGSHDGYDLQAQMIDSMITEQPGRVFVAASGNESNIPYHVGYNLIKGDTNFTWFAPFSYDGNVIYYDAWADTANFSKVQFAIGVDRISPYSFITRTAFSTVLSKPGVIVTDTIKNANKKRIGIVYTYTQLIGSTYSLEVQIVPDSIQNGKIGIDSSYYWSLITTGTGKIDCWYPDPTPIVNTIPNVATYPAIKNYKMPDTITTLCSSYQCSPHVITVGDYYNRRAFVDYDTVLRVLLGNAQSEGQLTYYSGVGPTRDGRTKPDITAPGDFCMSVLATPLRMTYINGAPGNIDIGAYHDYDGGTSTACPGVAGTAALYLQLYPTATAADVKNAIIMCSDQDGFTGATPNNHYGYGKVDAFKALTGCAPSSVQKITLPVTSLYAYPNPMKGSTNIDYDFSSVNEYCTAKIMFYDVMGKNVKSVELKNAKGTVTFSSAGMAAGTYFYSLIVDNKRMNTEKLSVVK